MSYVYSVLPVLCCNLINPNLSLNGIYGELRKSPKGLNHGNSRLKSHLYVDYPL